MKFIPIELELYMDLIIHLARYADNDDELPPIHINRKAARLLESLKDQLTNEENYK